ncbi:hypothetical protein Pmani_031306 [Petrolisthes manimaculis]|uniref:Uncharacterized protein n=1 Tax=Petrolisthes manimaculis TaxID=1843537 RepID=A0AAE1TS50_9EUCA|nr:hypothetical protein Pmani_031306 [Petrolisthes manimaculis]
MTDTEYMGDCGEWEQKGLGGQGQSRKVRRGRVGVKGKEDGLAGTVQRFGWWMCFMFLGHSRVILQSFEIW